MALVLGIETSCDETAVGIVDGRKLLANVISSSVEQHARFGGVVPEVASRAHLESMQQVIKQALKDASVTLNDIDAIAVTAGPGLIGALLVGVSSASGLALALDKPLFGVNHLSAHIAVDRLDNDAKMQPSIALLVSGGHSSILQVNNLATDVIVKGATIDDAAGEAFDKIARVLGLPFPGGPYIDQAAQSGNPNAIDFPRGLTTPKDMAKHRFDVSFSGLKTAVARWIETEQRAGNSIMVNDVAASFQEAIVDVLLRKAIDACLSNDVGTLVIGGGVAANSRLRTEAAQRCQEHNISLRIPRPELCTDNGAMVAALGSELVKRGRNASQLSFATDSSMNITNVVA